MDRLGLLFLAILSTVLLSTASMQATAQQLIVEQFSVAPVTNSFSRTGKLTFKRTVNLAFKSSGYLNRISVDEGDRFKEGDVLASIVTEELKADKNAKYAQLLQAKNNFTREQRLIDQGLGSEQAFDLATTNVETARSAYQVAYYNLEKAQIIAPFDGIVLARHTDLEQYQAPGTSALEVAAFNDNWVVKVALTGMEIASVRLGQIVTVVLPGTEEFNAKVNRIPAIAGDSNLFVIDVLIPQSIVQRGMLAGQIAQVNISQSQHQFGYKIPLDALIKMDEQDRAIVLVQNKLTKELSHQTFPIAHIDSQHIYLEADAMDLTLDIVVRGWQHLTVETQSSNKGH